MSIGKTVGINTKGQDLTERLATPGMDISTSIAQTHSKQQPVLQGAGKAVTPQADSTTGKVAPPIAGGLQMEKTVLVTGSQPVVETTLQQKEERAL